MKCPFCNQDNTRVVDSRPVDDTNSIRRRRLCDACGRRFTTYEKVESIPLTVIKKDQNREQYDRNKIQAGILRACYKRPIPIEKIEAENYADQALEYGSYVRIIFHPSRSKSSNIYTAVQIHDA